jgi:hypothetical protein
MTFGYDAQRHTDSFRRKFVKVVRTDQVWYVSVDKFVPFCDLACLLNDLSLPDSGFFRPVYLNHKFRAFQALVGVSRILRLASGEQHLRRTSYDSEVTSYLVSVIDIDVDGRRRWN